MTTYRKCSLHLIVAGLLCLQLACNKGAQIQGTYVNVDNQRATLQITADQMVVGEGPMKITCDYKVVQVNGNDVTVEVTAPNTPKGTALITIADNALVIKDNFLFGGHWKRK